MNLTDSPGSHKKSSDHVAQLFLIGCYPTFGVVSISALITRASCDQAMFPAFSWRAIVMKRRLLFAVYLCALTAVLNCGTNAKSTPASPSQDQFTRLPPEVRLRKLHLVRPDLIQYPISYEVYC